MYEDKNCNIFVLNFLPVNPFVYDKQWAHQQKRVVCGHIMKVHCMSINNKKAHFSQPDVTYADDISQYKLT